uniref:Methyltransferase n=1 Tax=viral metagenome TaxID=1070528 RepID=A0A6M3Y402_9ZZZZ
MPKQHVEYNRKIALRKNLLEKVSYLPGAFYVPFIGDGDLAFDLYQGRMIYGADIDEDRVTVAKSRLPDAEIIQADCDIFPFRDRDIRYSLADFDSYSYPYAAFRDFWGQAQLHSPFVLFFTDGQRQAISRTGHWTDPAGQKHQDDTVEEKRRNYGFYFNKIVLSWFEQYIEPWKIKEVTKYLRGPNMLYWGAIIETEQALIEPIDIDKDKKVEDALYEAALSGNTTAMQMWLEQRLPERWGRQPIKRQPGVEELLTEMKRNLPQPLRERLKKWENRIETKEELYAIFRLICGARSDDG